MLWMLGVGNWLLGQRNGKNSIPTTPSQQGQGTRNPCPPLGFLFPPAVKGRLGLCIEAAPGGPAIVLCHQWGGPGGPTCVTCVHLQRKRGQLVGFGVGLGRKG